MLKRFQWFREKIKPIDLSHPDVVALVTNQRASKKAFGNDYRGCCAIQEDYLTSSMFQTLDGKFIEYEKPSRTYINFLSPEVYPYTLWVGRELELYEGARLVGTMIIEEIKNKNLDRNAKFSDRENVLEDHKILNIALKRSLKFGDTYNKPLDNKLMKSVKDLSGNDIDKVVKYVLQVRNDVLWKIYFANYDIKKQELTIDGMKETSEKYPWIDENNLRELHGQGLYYAWRG